MFGGSSTTKPGRHDIAQILLKVALNTKKSINQYFRWTKVMEALNTINKKKQNLYTLQTHKNFEIYTTFWNKIESLLMAIKNPNILLKTALWRENKFKSINLCKKIIRTQHFSAKDFPKEYQNIKNISSKTDEQSMSYIHNKGQLEAQMSPYRSPDITKSS